MVFGFIEGETMGELGYPYSRVQLGSYEQMSQLTRFNPLYPIPNPPIFIFNMFINGLVGPFNPFKPGFATWLGVCIPLTPDDSGPPRLSGVPAKAVAMILGLC
jgi:hypothetical protein